MVSINGILEKFAQKGEKTNWTYVFISFENAEKINKGIKKSYRVKGSIDGIAFSQIALAPMGEGNFILPIKAALFKQIKKPIGEKVILKIEKDTFEKPLNEDLNDCLQEEKIAHERFFAMPKSHQKYYDQYVEAAKTPQTKAKRIAQIVHAMIYNISYADMLKSNKREF